MKALLKKHGITEKQVDLIRLVARHPVVGARDPSMARILPGALRHNVIRHVWLDQAPPITRTVTDHHIGCPSLTTTSNEWFELSEKAVALMAELDPDWKYERPSDQWA